MKHNRTFTGVAALILVSVGAACAGSDSEQTARPSVTFATVPSTDGSTTTPDTTAPDATAASGDAAPDTTPAPAPATPQSVPENSADLGTPAVAVEQVANLPFAVGLAVRPGANTLYVVQQGGLIIPVDDGVQGTPVLNIEDRTSADSEMGLLGLAFHPTEPYAYVNYIANDGGGDGSTVVAEYRVGDDGVFDASSRREVLTIAQPHNNHNGGDLVFGPDGFLYIGTGDGGSANDPDRRSLNVGDLLGKMLRIDPRPNGDQPYSVPADNPFVNVDGAKPEVYSVGLRNPWRYSFDRVTGDLWIGDVGQGEIEEIDVAWADQGGAKGLNFGWSAFEGTKRFNTDQSEDGVTPPIFEYAHGPGCSVSGGARYRGAAIPELAGWYVYADFCSGEIRALQLVDRAVAQDVLLSTNPKITAIDEGPDGELYALSHEQGLLAILPG
jgi:glucose/arabinose dehydrogenase